MPEPCDVHTAPDAEAKLEQLLTILEDLGTADVCAECIDAIRAARLAE